MISRSAAARLRMLATLSLLALALTGCASNAAGPPSSPSPSATPTPTPTPAAALGPEPRLEATCDTLLPLDVLAGFMGDAGEPLTVVPIAELTPDRAALAQLGGLSCDWRNTAPTFWAGTPEGGQSVTLHILPEGVDQAAAYVEAYQIADPTYGPHVQGPRCVAPGEGREDGFCELIGVIGDLWVEMAMVGIVVEPGATDASLRTAFLSITDPLVAALQLETPGARWSPPQASAIDACETVLPTADVAAITGFPDAWFGESWDGPRLGQYFFAAEATGALRCSIHPESGDNTYGAIHILPGGAWGYDAHRDEWLASGSTQQLTGLAAGAAVLRCADETAVCRLDLSLAGHWIAIEFPPVPGEEAAWVPSVDYGAARASIVSLAEAAVANLTGGAAAQ